MGLGGKGTIRDLEVQGRSGTGRYRDDQVLVGTGTNRDWEVKGRSRTVRYSRNAKTSPGTEAMGMGKFWLTIQHVCPSIFY